MSGPLQGSIPWSDPLIADEVTMRFLFTADWWSGALTFIAVSEYHEGRYWSCAFCAVFAAYNYIQGWREHLRR